LLEQKSKKILTGMALVVFIALVDDRSREQDCPSRSDYLNPNQPAHTGRGVTVWADFAKTFTAIFKSLRAFFLLWRKRKPRFRGRRYGGRDVPLFCFRIAVSAALLE